MRRYFDNMFMRLSGKTPRKINLFGFDTETYNNNKNFLLGSIVGNGFEKTYYSREDMIYDLTHLRIFRNGFLCATNLMFDFNALFPDIADNIKMFHIIERSGDLILCKGYIRYKQDGNFYSSDVIKCRNYDIKDFYHVSFIDSTAHLKSSVENLGKIIKSEKLLHPEFLGNKPKTDEEWEYLRRYNLQDSRITFEFMTWLQDWYNNLGGQMKPTISSTAMDIYRRKYLGMDWHLCGKDEVLKLYNAYYGGRTEAFKRGLFTKENYGLIKVYDVNSLYPYEMRKDFPIPYEYFTKDKITTDDIESYYGIGYFKLKSPDMDIPLVPVASDKLRFPSGIIKGWYDFATVKEALNNDYEMLQGSNGLLFNNSFVPFRTFVDSMYAARMKLKGENNSAELVPKIVMNSLYGKFGYQFQNKEYLTDFEGQTRCINETVIPVIHNKIYRVITTENSEIPKYVYPILPIYVTAYARIDMFKRFKKIGHDRVLYTDTDSIMTTRNLPTSSELGDIKLEKEFEKLIIIKPKMYSGITCEGKNLIKVKGVHGAISDFNHFMRLIQDFKVTTTHFRKLRGSLIGNGRYVNELYTMEKKLDLNDSKRVWDKDAFTLDIQDSRPFVLDESDYT